MIFQFYWIHILIVCGKSVLGDKFFLKDLPCNDAGQFMKIKEEQVPKLEVGTSWEITVNVTAEFEVGFSGKNVMGNLTLTFDEDGNRTELNFIVKLTMLYCLNDQRNCTQYFWIVKDMEEFKRNRHWSAELNCIYIPPIPNAVIKVEVFQIDMTSCNCDNTEMSYRELHICIYLCYMYHVSTHCFHVSEDACYFFRHHNHDDIYMTLKADTLSRNLTHFRGYFTNVNPYSLVQVSVFPDDYRHEPHVPIWMSFVKVTPDREVYFSVVGNGLGYTKFYTKMTVSCVDDEQGYEYISETATSVSFSVSTSHDTLRHPEGAADVIDSNDDENDYPQPLKQEVVYGIVVGLLCFCCIITFTIWLKIFQRKRHRSMKRRSYRVEEGQEDGSLQRDLCTPSMCLTESLNNQSYHLTDGRIVQERDIMLLFHPDSDNHRKCVDNLILCLEKFNIRVHSEPEQFFSNWRDFAEKAGDYYKDIVFILSRRLIELCELYKKRGYGVNNLLHVKRWNELLEERNGEYIPCVVLDKLRSAVQDKSCNVQTHFVIFSDTDGSDTVSMGELSDKVGQHIASDTVCLQESAEADTVCIPRSNDIICMQESVDMYTVSIPEFVDTCSLNKCSDTVSLPKYGDSVYEKLKDLSDTVCFHSCNAECMQGFSGTCSWHKCFNNVCKYNQVYEANKKDCFISSRKHNHTFQDKGSYRDMPHLNHTFIECFDAQFQEDFFEFFKHFTFFDMKHTYFHVVTTKVS